MANAENLSFSPATDFAVDTQTNSAATGTIAAPGLGFRWFICGISFSASAAPAAAVRVLVKQGTTTIDSYEVPASAFAPVHINFVRPLRGAENALVSITLPALGAGVVGDCAIHAFKGSV